MTTRDTVQALVGTSLGPSEWRTLTEEAVNRLEELTRGEARLKVDPDRARHHTLAQQGGTIVPGFVTLAVGEAQLQRLLPASAVYTAAPRIRFITPVMMQQPIRTRATVQEITTEAQAIVAMLQVHIEVAGADKPACVVDQVVRWEALA
jgi:acyl dehydratase